jgi:hypothetical protein
VKRLVFSVLATKAVYGLAFLVGVRLLVRVLGKDIIELRGPRLSEE